MPDIEIERGTSRFVAKKMRVDGQQSSLNFSMKLCRCCDGAALSFNFLGVCREKSWLRLLNGCVLELPWQPTASIRSLPSGVDRMSPS